MIWIYNLAIRCYVLAVRITALTGNIKARKWLEGRSGWREKISYALRENEYRVWFHCASLGEYEQGRPLMDAWKKKYPLHKIVLTFFSSSGYDSIQTAGKADYVFYLPPDSRRNAIDFLNLVVPQKIFFIKYEYWYHFSNEASGRGIPVFFVSAIFRKAQPFFKWYGGLFRKILRRAASIFVQNEYSKNLLHSIGIERVAVTGDTRFDRVKSIAVMDKKNPVAELFCHDQRSVLVAGSTWPVDESLLAGFMMKNKERWKLILVPHEISETGIQETINRFNFCKVAASKGNRQVSASDDVLVVNEMGLLSGLYRYGQAAYVGGGFGNGIHNTLEAAVFGIPVAFGPVYKKYNEAVELVNLECAFVIENQTSLEAIVATIFENDLVKRSIGEELKDYFESKSGAVQRIMNWVENP